MAEPSLHHSTSPDPVPNNTHSSDGSGSSPRQEEKEKTVDEGFEAAAGSNRVHSEGSVHAPVSLPLRQAWKPRAAQSKIHDVTEKFTAACAGRCFVAFSFGLGVPMLGIASSV